jgi:hypothetical protein
MLFSLSGLESYHKTEECQRVHQLCRSMGGVCAEVFRTAGAQHCIGRHSEGCHILVVYCYTLCPFCMLSFEGLLYEVSAQMS